MAFLRLSYSQLKVYKECKLRYTGKYIAKEKGVVDLSKALVGIAVHNAFDDWIQDPGWRTAPKEARAMLGIAIAKAWAKAKRSPHTLTPQELNAELGRAVAMVDPLVDGIKKHGLLTRRMDIEASRTVSLSPELRVYIRPDMVVWKSPYEAILVDGKTTQNKKYLDNEQLYFYRSFLNYEAEVPITKAGFFLFHTGEFVEVDLAKAPSTEDHVAEVKGYAKDIFQLRTEREDKPIILRDCFSELANPGNACTFCEFKDSCRKYAPEQIPKGFEKRASDKATKLAEDMDVSFVTI